MVSSNLRLYYFVSEKAYMESPVAVRHRLDSGIEFIFLVEMLHVLILNPHEPYHQCQ